MTFTEAVKTVLSKYATFTGRAARPEFWWWCLFTFLLGIATGFIDHLVIGPRLGIESFAEDSPEILSAIVSLGLLLPGLAVSVRRLHDIDRSGWWLLIILIPLIGVLVLIYWTVQRGTDGPNRFGKSGTEDAALSM